GMVWIVVAVVSALACGPAAPAAGPPPAASAPAASGSAHSPEVQRLLAAAQAAGETELNLYWSQNTLGGEDGSRKYAAAFERLYGISVPITYTPGPSMPDVAARIGQEIAAGRKPSTDVYVGAEQQLASMLT